MRKNGSRCLTLQLSLIQEGLLGLVEYVVVACCLVLALLWVTVIVADRADLGRLWHTKVSCLLLSDVAIASAFGSIFSLWLAIFRWDAYRATTKTITLPVLQLIAVVTGRCKIAWRPELAASLIHRWPRNIYIFLSVISNTLDAVMGKRAEIICNICLLFAFIALVTSV